MKNTLEGLLQHDHESLDQLLTSLEVALTGPDKSQVFELLDFFWARLAVHIRAENLHLFPALAKAPSTLFTGAGGLPTFKEVRDILARLRSDHDFFMKELARLIKAMRESGTEAIQQGDLRASLTDIRQRLEEHNLVEEEQAYLWPSLLFDEETIATLSGEIRGELDKLPPRFA